MIELDDYRKIWEHAAMRCNFCDKVWAAVFRYDTKELECPSCGKVNKIEEGP